MSEKKRIVILGAGFAGMYTYLSLLKKPEARNLQITLVNKTDEFLFIPLIHEVATGSLTPSSVVQPIRSVARECRFLEGEVTSINMDNNHVTVKNRQIHKTREKVEEPEVEIPYDYLVISMGARTNFQDVPGAKEHSLTLYTLRNAKDIKNQIIESFEKAQFLNNDKEREKVLTFVVVGGGPTGTELAAEIADFINTSIRKTFNSLSKMSRVILIHKGPRLLEPAEKWFGVRGKKVLEDYGVEVILNARVEAVHKDHIATGNRRIDSENVFWSAGIQAIEVPMKNSRFVEKDERTKRMKVNNFLQIASYENVFVAGDQAYLTHKDSGQPYPMRAQFATREGANVAENIMRSIENKSLKEFYYNDMGFIVSFGRGKALAKLLGFRLSGPLAWFAYRTAYFFKIPGTKAKIRTAVEWTMNLFFARDVSKL